MIDDEVTKQCKKILAVQDELIKEFKNEAKKASDEFRSIAEEIKRHVSHVPTASSNLQEAAKTISKKNGNTGMYVIIVGVLIITVGLCAYMAGLKARSNEFNAAVEHRAQELGQTMPKTKK